MASFEFDVDAILLECSSSNELYADKRIKKYLRDRELNLSGNRKLLCEKVFGAFKLGLPKCSTPDEDDKTKELDKINRLVLEDGLIKLPFPDSLKVAWQNGSQNFPDTTEEDVEKYLKAEGLKANVKGSSLEDSKHVADVAYHNISANIRYCYVKGKCIPQERTNNIPYEPWVCLHKESGSVITAECSCVAGLGEICKHVGALLWFIASEVRKGNNKSCTCKQQVWDRPSSSSRKRYSATKFSDIVLKKARTKHEQMLRNHKPKLKRSSYDPRALHDRRPMQFSADDIKELETIADGDCCFLLHVENPWKDLCSTPDITHTVREEIIESENVADEPISISALAEEIQTSHASSSLPEQCSVLLQHLSLTEDQRDIIAKDTHGQSENKKWSEYRKGVITASRILDVVRKIDEDGSISNQASADNLVAAMLDYKKTVSTKAMKWGVINEPYIREQYKREMMKEHTHFSLSETGLVLSTDCSYLGASPDAFVSCSCCGKGLAEFKTTWSHREKTIEQYAKVASTCLHSVDGKVKLKATHKYYYQVQMLMGVLNVDYADFYLTTSCDRHKERVSFNEQLWNEILPKAHAFFKQCLLPELLGHSIQTRYIIQELIDALVAKVDENLNLK